jgi:hypothetical protein
VPGDHSSLMIAGGAFYAAVGAVAGINSILEGGARRGAHRIAIAAATSLFWPLAVMTVAAAIAMSWPTTASKRLKKAVVRNDGDER